MRCGLGVLGLSVLIVASWVSADCVVECPPSTPATAPSTQPATELLPVNVRHMLSGYCFAGSRIPDKQAPGGFWASPNLPVPFESAEKLQPRCVYLFVDSNANAVFAEKYKGIELRLVNGTQDIAEFRASDSRLSIVQEARDEQGNWREIEYLPRSWCGNSYHRVLLAPGECWVFAAPRYEGQIKTRLRFKLMMQNNESIYSAEFHGSINPEQFTVKHPHTPTNLMDPYSG